MWLLNASKQEVSISSRLKENHFFFRDSFKIIPIKNSRKDSRSDTDLTTQSIQFSQKANQWESFKKVPKIQFRNFKTWTRILKNLGKKCVKFMRVREFFTRILSNCHFCNTLLIWPWASFRCFWLLGIVQWVPHVFLLW